MEKNENATNSDVSRGVVANDAMRGVNAKVQIGTFGVIEQRPMVESEQLPIACGRGHKKTATTI